jgi:wobble nucleotide-excising tRNase
LAVEAKKGEPYDWVKYVFIDDPISSLDEHNTVAVASDLASLLKAASNDVKVLISTHHGLFFNVMFNELKGKKTPNGKDEIKKKAYILHRLNESPTYTLQDTGESPFLHHVAALAELQAAAKSGKISQYHFNSLRSILEKTAIFFGRQHLSTCFDGLPPRKVFGI